MFRDEILFMSNYSWLDKTCGPEHIIWICQAECIRCLEKKISHISKKWMNLNELHKSAVEIRIKITMLVKLNIDAKFQI